MREILARREGGLGNLMPVLAGDRPGVWLFAATHPRTSGLRWGVRIAEILRVASFYDRFRFEPAGRHVVEVCEGTSCHSRGSRELRERLEKELGVGAGETDTSGRFTLRTVRCLGLCALSPAMKIDGRGFARVNIDRAAEILEQFA